MCDRTFCRKYHEEQIKYIINAFSRRMTGDNIFQQNYAREVMLGQQGNDLIRQALQNNVPFMAARFGGNEIRILSDVLFEKAGGKCGGISKRSRYKITNQAGFFPDDKEMIYRLAEVYLESSKAVDVLGVWNMFLQAEISKRYLPQAQLCELGTMEPYYYANPWSKALEGKDVLVIHPFTDTIKKQYEKRDKLFTNDDILPEFKLKTVKAVQTIAGRQDNRYNSWFEALDSMYDAAMNEAFDVALIGCGAYGFPLAARIKASGKKAVHMGGALQILFGIKGKRWDNHEIISKMYNEYWVRPGENEKVSNSKVVEGSCYW